MGKLLVETDCDVLHEISVTRMPASKNTLDLLVPIGILYQVVHAMNKTIYLRDEEAETWGASSPIRK